MMRFVWVMCLGCLLVPNAGFSAEREDEWLRTEDALQKAGEGTPIRPEQVGVNLGMSLAELASDRRLLDESLDQIADVGARWVRATLALDESLDSSKHRLDVTAVVDRFRDSGISILLALDAPDTRTRFVSTAVGLLKGRATHYEILNDPASLDSPSPAYARFLLAASRAARSADSTCVLLAAPVDRVTAQDLKKFEAFLKELGKARPFDILALHVDRAATGPGDPNREGLTLAEEIDRVRTLLTRKGFSDVPIWLTRVGWPARAAEDSDTPAASTCSEEDQARFLTETFALPRTIPELQKVFWSDLRDPTPAGGVRSVYGLFSSAGLPRASYHACKKLTW